MKTLLILFGLLTVLSNHSHAEGRLFLIRPYLFSHLGTQIGIGWMYESQDQTIKTEANLYKANVPVAELKVESDNGVFFTYLPLPACGFDTDYQYTVTGLEKPISIESVPCAGTTEEPLMVSFVSDTQEYPDQAKIGYQLVSLFPSKAILHGGDVVQTGNKFDEWVDFFDALSPVGSSRTTYFAVGNHDYRYDTEVPLWNRFFRYDANESHYVAQLGNLKLFVLNTCFEDRPDLAAPEYRWIAEQLETLSKTPKSERPWVAVLFHHPPYSSGLAHNALAPRKEHLILQKYFIPLFEESGVDLVLSGHTHLYEHSFKSGIHYVTTGATGGKLGYWGGKNPYRVIAVRERSIVNFKISKKSLNWTALNFDLNVLEDVTLNRTVTE